MRPATATFGLGCTRHRRRSTIESELDSITQTIMSNIYIQLVNRRRRPQTGREKGSLTVIRIASQETQLLHLPIRHTILHTAQKSLRQTTNGRKIMEINRANAQFAETEETFRSCCPHFANTGAYRFRQGKYGLISMGWKRKPSKKSSQKIKRQHALY